MGTKCLVRSSGDGRAFSSATMNAQNAQLNKWKLRINTYLHVSQDAWVFREEALSFPQDSISPTLKEVEL
jgi:hypothetical protein